jgi:mannose-6-phosphate isomerase-like protein (cupin superfamily)
VRKRRARIFLTVLVGLFCLIPIRGRGQEKLTTAPFPSYTPGGPADYRHPEVDTDVFLYINHWKNSTPVEDHGGLTERDILTRGNPLHPVRKGAVLKYIKSCRRAVLPPRTNTVPVNLAREQVFFYFTSGVGRVEAGGKESVLEEGSAVFIPAGLEFRFLNPSDNPLEMYLVVEETAPGFIPNKEMSVGSCRCSPPVFGTHWAHIAHPFVYDLEPKFSNSMGFVVISIDGFDIAQPHTHGSGTEEIWLQLRGRSLLFLGNRLLWQEPGEAFLVPPNDKVPHASINHSEEPMRWLFMGSSHPEEASDLEIKGFSPGCLGFFDAEKK